MNANEILEAVGKDLNDTEQKFLKFLATYENEKQEGKEASFNVMDCAFDLFVMLENLASNHKTLRGKFEDLQRAIRLNYYGYTTKDEMREALIKASEGITIFTSKEIK